MVTEMRELKDSGTQWVGKIPSHWDIGRIDSFYTLRNTKVSDADFPPLSVTMKGILPQLETAAKTNAHDDRKLVRKGDFAINSRSDRRGSCGISEYDGSVSLINTILAPKGEMHPKYFDWLFHTVQFADEFYKWGHGIVDDLWTTNYQDMKKINIPVPTITEQKEIADYLDKQCAEIDALYADIQAEIDTLEAYKQSVIAEAVTKGLDKNVPMKDSGTKWCPKIPCNWERTNPKALFKQRFDRAYNGERQLTASQEYGIVYQDEFMEMTGNRVVTVLKDFSILKHVEPEDFVISMRSFQGGLEYSEIRGCISSAYVMLIPNKKLVYPPFYRWFFKSSTYINAIQSTSNLIRDGQAMRYANFVQVPLFIIPIDEQKKISEYLDEKVNDIDLLLKDKQKQLEILIGYKKSIIYEYVTGKKEVPSA